MPKLNVQQNNQNIIQAFRNALAIGNLKGIIASDGNHNFSTAGSNPNLLDNPWWGSGEIINQRQITTLGEGFVFDRWKYEVRGSGNVAEVTSSGVAFTYTTGYFDVYQTLEPSLVSFLTGKVATVSALLDDGRIIKGSATFPATSTINITPQSAGVQIIYQPSYSRIYFRPYTNCTIRAVKLELGSVSTLANDAPPDYGEELLKCQRYFTRWYSTAGSSAIGLALAVGTTNANFALLSNLRAEGSATVSFTGLVLSDGTDKTVTNVSVAGAGDGKSMRLLVTSSGLTAYRPYVLQITAGGHLDVSKDL